MASTSLAQLIYRGKLRPPLTHADVQDAVAKLFRVPPAQALALLQSSQVVLKKNLTAAELLPYFERLSQLGLVVTIEPMAEPKPAVPEPVKPQEPSALEIESAPVVETITCPKCSHVQPKRTLCLGCGVDMPRFAAAQISERQEAIEQKYKPNLSMGANRVQLDEVSAPPIFSLDFEGRLGRLRYFNYSIAWILPCVLSGFVFVLPLPTFLRVVIFLLVALVCLRGYIRLSVLRAHDLDHGGGLLWFLLLPGVNVLLSLFLSLWPGKKEANRYGLPVEANHGLAFIVPVLLLGLSALSAYKAAHNPKAMERFSKQPEAAQESNTSARSDVVVMYSTTGCPYCQAAREWFAKHNVEYVECNTETDSACNEAYQDLDEAQGVPTFVLGSEIQSGYSEDWLEQRFLRQ